MPGAQAHAVQGGSEIAHRTAPVLGEGLSGIAWGGVAFIAFGSVLAGLG